MELGGVETSQLRFNRQPSKDRLKQNKMPPSRRDNEVGFDKVTASVQNRIALRIGKQRPNVHPDRVRFSEKRVAAIRSRISLKRIWT